MKGFMIYETPLWGNEENTVYLQEVKDASYTLKQIGSDDITCYLEGIATKDPVTKATCNKDDTYDFETGALIALMKMCGKDKVTKACDELYKDDNYKNALQEMTENNEKLIEENNYLKYVISCRESAIESLENTRDLLINKNDELKEENEKLKLDCEKLQHGYNDMIFCRGRQNGKQHTALVNMFKKLDQKKVDAAYKEAYGDKIIWCTSQPTIRDTVDSLIEESRAFTRKCVEEWLYGPLTKREEMWENILNASQDPPVDIKVAKQDIKTFLKELQDKIPEARWNGSDCLLTEYTNPYWFNHDYIYFALFTYIGKGDLRICYDNKPHSWINKPVIDYLPPMRWDLFEKGRKIVRVTPENIDDFIVKCTNKFGSIMKPVLKRYKDFTHAFIMISDYHYDNKPTIHIMTPEDLVRNQHENPKKYSDKKIVDWEDVR